MLATFIVLLTLFLPKQSSDCHLHPNKSDEQHNQRGGMMLTRIWYPQAMSQEGSRCSRLTRHCRQGQSQDGVVAVERSVDGQGRQIRYDSKALSC